jgi:hypothetical protein
MTRKPLARTPKKPIPDTKDKLTLWVTLMVSTTLCISVLAMVISFMLGLWAKEVDNAEIFKMISPAFSTLIGGMIGFLSGIKLMQNEDKSSGGLLGSIFGGIFRMAPEVLKWLDKKNERQHELNMFKFQCDLEAQRGQQKLAEIGAQREAAIDVGVMDAFNNAITQQTEMVKAAGGWVASLSASVRPMVTYWILFVWSFIHVWFAWNAWLAGAPSVEVFKTMMTPDFSALLSGTINYWFLDRTLSKRGI